MALYIFLIIIMILLIILSTQKNPHAQNKLTHTHTPYNSFGISNIYQGKLPLLLS